MQFDYYGQNYLHFEKAFHELWIGELPLTYLTDDLLKAMSPDKPYFQIPPQQCVLGVRVWFRFEVAGDKYRFEGVYNSRN